MRQTWTDLALEAGAAQLQPEITQLEHGIERTTVVIRDEETAKQLGRPAASNRFPSS